MWESLKRWMGWTNAESPLTDERRKWIDERWTWLQNEFGEERLHEPLLTPSHEDFPEAYTGSPEDAERLLDRVCDHMGVERSRLELRLYKSEMADDVAAGFRWNYANRSYALGAYEPTDQKILIWLEKSHLHDALSVVSTLAHEVGHVLLLADGRYSSEEPDHEPLTDLLTVFFGLGIFTANSTLRSVNWRYGNWEGWNISRQGYLTMPEVAYALSRYVEVRGEIPPPWQRYLRADIHSLLSYELHLRQRPLPAHAFAASGEEPVPNQEADNPEATADDADSEDHPESKLPPGDAHFSQAEFLTTQGNYEAAVEQYSAAIEQQPDDWEAYQKRAMVLMTLDRYAESIADATQAIEHGSTDCDPYVYRSRCYVALREYEKALDDAHRAVRIASRDPAPYQARAAAYLRLGEFPGALIDINRAIDLHPRWAECYLLRSQIHAKAGDERQARRDEEEAIRRDEHLSDETVRRAHMWWAS